MKNTTRANLCIVLFLAATLSAAAQTTYNWSGNTDNLWSTATNWTPTDSPTGPAANDTAALGDATANRTLIYDAAAPGTLGTLTYAQTSAATNTLEVRRTLTLTNALNISAADTAHARLFINTAPTAGDNFAAITSASIPVLTATAGTTLGNGGILEFGRKTSTDNNSITYLSGPLTLDGGTLAMQLAVRSSATTLTSFIYSINGNVTMNSGALVIGSANTNIDATYTTTIADTRLRIMDNFIANGGSIQTNGNNINGLTLAGSENKIGTAVTISGNLGVVLQSSANPNQSLENNKTISSLTLRGSNNAIKTLSGNGSIGNLNFWADNNQSLTLKLDDNLTVTTELKRSSGTGATLTLDTNTHILDTSAGTLNLANATWNITGNGTLKAKAFNLSAATATNVEGTTTLLATTAGGTNNLGGTGTISANSTFLYADTTDGAAATLESNRAIGSLNVQSGTLKLAGTANIAATSVTVQAGATLDLTTRAFISDALTLSCNGAATGRILTSDTTFAAIGALTLQLDAALATDAVTFFDGLTLTGDGFDSVTLAGIYGTIALSQNDNIWSGLSADALNTFTFSQLTGELTITSVPEPATVGTLAALATLAVALVHRRRAA
ncbi:anchor protein [Opitutaceae bacterium TAV5]|nr:anchor protein [Opitutaceae bacterium TAV5]